MEMSDQIQAHVTIPPGKDAAGSHRTGKRLARPCRRSDRGGDTKNSCPRRVLNLGRSTHNQILH
jgi:hypothetical protein